MSNVEDRVRIILAVEVLSKYINYFTIKSNHITIHLGDINIEFGSIEDILVSAVFTQKNTSRYIRAFIANNLRLHQVPEVRTGLKNLAHLDLYHNNLRDKLEPIFSLTQL